MLLVLSSFNVGRGRSHKIQPKIMPAIHINEQNRAVYNLTPLLAGSHQIKPLRMSLAYVKKHQVQILTYAAQYIKCSTLRHTQKT
jgi:hypothetical protein